MTTRRQMKTGGVLIGMIVAIVAVGVLSAAMVKSLHGEAVTVGHVYDVMRARYAADSGNTFFSSLSPAQKLDYASKGDVSFTLENGDQFIIHATTNSAYLFAKITGRRMAGNAVRAVRVLNRQMSLDGNGFTSGLSGETIPGDDLAEDLSPGAVPEITVDPDQNWSHTKNDLKDFIKTTAWGTKKGWVTTYAHLVNLHEKLVAEQLPTLLGESLKIRTDLDVRHAEIDPSEKNHVIWEVAVPLSYQKQAQAALKDGYLSYEVQMKLSWQEKNRNFYTPYSRVTGAQGLAFKLRGNETDGYEYYAVTVMRFLDENEKDNRIDDYADLNDAKYSPNLTGWNNSDGYWGDYDCIPNDIKPSNMKNKYLLVLWKQEQGRKNPERTWIACQDLTGDSIANANFMLDATIYVSVAEGIEGTKEFINVKMMVGDNRYNDRPPGDDNPYNRGWWTRRRYRNSTDLPDSFNTEFPVWPIENIQNWTADVDYYTIANKEKNSMTLNGNSAIIQTDGETIRMYDSDCIFVNQQNQLGDLGLVFCGNFMSGMDHDLLTKDGEPKVKNPTEDDYRAIDIPSLYMAVDDLAMKWGNTTVTESGIDIITSF